MQELNGWPFEPFDGEVDPMGGEGAGPGNPY